ncbi:MAG: amino acid-binding protein [Oscillospiraceae bacterium]|nr:amino acid-binding protein [Oscillospiraceae bacterium]
MAKVIEQISVFLENRPGSLVEILELLAGQGIDLRAYSMAETSDYGIMRIIVHDSGAVMEALRAAGFTARKTEVLGVLIPDRPGASVETFRLLSGAGINVEYTYAFALAGSGQAVLLLRVDDNARAGAVLSGAGIALAQHREIF